MPYYSRFGKDIVEQDTVIGPDFILNESNRTIHTYPVDAWYWYLTADDAKIGMMTSEDIALLQKQIVTQAQARLDSFAQERGYDNILSASSYVSSSVSKFAQEARDCLAIRDATWSALHAFMGEVTSGNAPQPLDADAVLALLPVPVWTV